MTVQAITLNLPQTVYEQIRQAAEKAQRPVNEVLVEAVTAVAPVIGIAPLKNAYGVGANGLETLLGRAQATVLLKQRGYDTSDPQQFAPLE